MVDATDLKSVFRKEVRVRVPPPAPKCEPGQCPMRPGAGGSGVPFGRAAGASGAVSLIKPSSLGILEMTDDDPEAGIRNEFVASASYIL